MAQQPPVSKEELNDLFQDESAIPVTGWQTFKSVGDSIQGTLLEEPVAGVSAKFGTPQITYTLQTAEGEVVMFSLNPNTNVKAVRQLKQAEVGDLVGIKLSGWYIADIRKEVNDEELLKLKPSLGGKNPGKNFDIRVRHNNLAPRQVEEAEPFPGKTPGMDRTATAPVQTALGSDKPVTPAGTPTPEQKLAQIIELGKSKLGAKTDDEAKALVMEKTATPLIASRYDEILVKLIM